MVAEMRGKVREEPAGRHRLTEDVDRIFFFKIVGREFGKARLYLFKRRVDSQVKLVAADVRIGEFKIAVSHIPAAPDNEPDKVPKVAAQMQAKITARVRSVARRFPK